ncbi:MAG: sigma-70 family RNA polymerase sigma factor [Actinobacteria bacterium]|jgi:RNA polymerase sigma-70 factor (ECF subfamily)|nr:sigma-70 family RNA polymerase sigma factor [Actinomycetota bacterium]
MESGAQTSATQRHREGDLLEGIARGDQAALRQLYRAFERPLYTLGIRWLHDQALSEELVQEVTLRIWRRASSFDPSKGAASSWIFGIARNVASDLGRARQRVPTPVGDLVVPTGSEPWDEESSWQQWQVATAIQNLPVEQQRIIHLAYVLQFTQSEIAKALDIPLGTVKTRLYQGLRALRPMLSELGITEGADR